MDITLTTEQIDELPSRLFRGYDGSEHAHVADFIDMLFAEYSRWAREVSGQQRIRKKDEIKVHLTCLTLELFRTYCIHPELSMAISLGNGTINSYKKSRYKPHHISFKILNHVFKFLEYQTYLELPLGEKGRATGATSHQRATRIRATEHFIVIMKQFHIDLSMISQSLSPVECIILRAKKRGSQTKGALLEYEDSDFTSKARTHLASINDSLSKYHINLETSDQQQVELVTRLSQRKEKGKPRFLDFNDKQLRRIFNNGSFEQGGRFYGGFWQAIPKEYRFLITINGSRTVQCDYSGMHFAILYARKGLAVPDTDFYQLDGFNDSLRSDIKKAFNILINCETVPQGVSTISNKIENGDLSSELGDGYRVYNAFRQKHEAISEYIASGEGVKLQFIDSQIAELLLLKGIENEVCILPIHDGFITMTEHEDILYQLMAQAYEEVVGSSINISPESVYLQLITDSQKGLSPLAVTADKEGSIQQLDIDEFSGQADSFSTVLGVKDILSKMGEYTQFHSREAEWLRMNHYFL